MATSKNIPRRLVSDTDEKMLQPSDMVDALNVTVSDDGEGTSGVIKNVRGTEKIYFDSTTLERNDGFPFYGSGTKVIGTVEDDSRGHIYFFVSKDDSDTGYAADNEDAIYRYSKDDGYYVEVLKRDMGFGDETNITATVVSGYFSQTTSLETIVYFTGDSLLHPPRKINADRAIAGDYDLRDDLTDGAENILLSTAKPSTQICPEVTFETDEGIGVNNFAKKSFQFAIQLVYKDGEVSAISPYSKLAYSSVIPTQGIQSASQSTPSNEDNVCVITTNYASYTGSDFFRPDVKNIRILGRNGNSSEMFVVDEFPPDQSITRKVMGVDREVYNHHSRIYRFYNDSAYRAVDQDTVLKPYDNVPKYAMGQTISGNRLTYSYYKEGYDNGDSNGNAVSGTLTERVWNYTGAGNGRPHRQTLASGTTDTNAIVTNHTAYAGIDVELANASGIGSSDKYKYGTEVNLSFDLELPSNVQIYGASGTAPILYGFVKDSSGYKYGGHIGGGSSNQLTLTEDHDIKFEFNHKLSLHETDQHGLYKEMISAINAKEITATFSYAIADGEAPMVLDYAPSGSSTFAEGDTVDFVGTVKVEWSLFAEDIGTASAHTGIRIIPAIRRVYDADLSPASDETNASSGEVFTAFTKRQHRKFIFAAIDNSSEVEFDEIPKTNTNVTVPYATVSGIQTNLSGVSGSTSSKSIKVQTRNCVSSFKTGSSHDIGIVYFDEFNRPGFVNKIGSFYSEFMSGDSRNNSAEIFAPSLCEVEMTSAPPSWAKSFQFVYPGMGSFSRMFSYSTGEARAAFDQGEWENANETASPTITTDSIRGGGADAITLWEKELQQHLVVDVKNKYVYIPLTTLAEFKKKKGAIIDYNYQAGDILRIICGAQMTSPTEGPGLIGQYSFKKASSDKPMSFRVIDQVTYYDDEDNPLYPKNKNSSPKKMPKIMQGRFLVCEPLGAGLPYNDDGDIEKFPGYDWHSISHSRWDNGGSPFTDDVNYVDPHTEYSFIGEPITYSNGDTPSDIAWSRALVEVLTPRDESSDRVWYEIGECHDISKHSQPIIIAGDAYMRYSSVNGPNLGYYNLDTPSTLVFNTGRPPEAWGFNDSLIETSYISDYIEDSEVWSKGRTHVEVKNDGERFYRSSIVHSDEYQSDINILTLSSFNPAKANFFNFDKKYGSLYYIGDYNDRLIGLQQQKVSLTTVNKNVISYADGGGTVAVSENPFGSTMYASADFGLSDPYVGSVVNTGSAVYFIDYDREEIGMVQGNNVVSISDIGMRSAFEDVFEAYKSKASPVNIVSGHDPRDQVVFFTFDTGDSDSKTYGYSEKTRGWASRYSFIPDRYATVDNRLFSFYRLNGALSGDPYYNNIAHLMHEHTDSADRAKFYGTSNSSSITFVVNAVPGKVKVFDALSLETDSDNWESPSGGVTTDLGSSGRIRSFETKEGVRYSAFGRDEANNVATLIPLGKNVDAIPSVIDSSTGSITFSNKLDRLPLKKNMITGPLVGGVFIPTDLTIKKVNGKELTFNDYGGASYGANQFEWFASQSTNEVNGDPIRGAWAKVKLENDSTSQYELYAINTHISDSPNHYG